MSRFDPEKTITHEEAVGAFSLDGGTGRLTRKANGSFADVTMACGYRVVYFAQRRYKAHRIVWLMVHGSWPVECIDHINGDRSDNRPSNLREADTSLNLQNLRRARCDNKTGFLGVHRQGRRFRSRIRDPKGKYLSLGLFDSAEEAHKAYVEAKRQLHPGCTI